MSQSSRYSLPPQLILGEAENNRVPLADQRRQRTEVAEILQRLQHQPGVILADEVGMGKTFVALGVAWSVAVRSRHPVIVMAPSNLIDKWRQDLHTFCELYLRDQTPVFRDEASQRELRAAGSFRYGVARHSVELLKLLDDARPVQCHLIFLAQGAMSRQQTDKWIRLALIQKTLRKHARGRRERLIKVYRTIHRYLAELLRAIGEQNASRWGEELWEKLLHSNPEKWMEIYNSTARGGHQLLTDNPVPAAVVEAMNKVDLAPIAAELEEMPVRARGGAARVSERISAVRQAIRDVEKILWNHLLKEARWRSPLLVMDEAHHLKNPGTSLARQLQSPDAENDLKTGDGAMAGAFDRMLFLTATPFQLGHAELVRVLQRFGDVRWNPQALGKKSEFEIRLSDLESSLTASQRAGIQLQRCWSRLRLEEGPEGTSSDEWWSRISTAPRDELSQRQKCLVEAFENARQTQEVAQAKLQPWLIRHNKGDLWSGTNILRRVRRNGAAILGSHQGGGGLKVPPEQLLPFFLAARSAASPGQDLLGEALCSSYAAFRFTRKGRLQNGESEDRVLPAVKDLTSSAWYLSAFDETLTKFSERMHPKVAATVRKAVDLWEVGEKVLVFAFYRQTCRALRVHISREIDSRTTALALRKFSQAGRSLEARGDVDRVIQSIHDRFFDKATAPGRRALDAALQAIVDRRRDDLTALDLTEDQISQLVDIMRRFLRVYTTLVRCFPIEEYDTAAPDDAVERMLDAEDHSRISWRAKFSGFIDFLVDRCTASERNGYLEATAHMQTGAIRVTLEEGEDEVHGQESRVVLANVQEATGGTDREHRSRLMCAFNTPFFPDVLVCSRVMGEGVDLHRYCRHVIHHDLDWNPSNIEQRTGRIDRLGCKAESRHPIEIFLPYVEGTADERQFRVMTDREQWFRIVMGQDEVASLIPPESRLHNWQLPEAFSRNLTFNLGLSAS